MPSVSPFPSPDSEPPWISVEEMREVDRRMISDYGIELIQMMENAGRCLAEAARRLYLDGDGHGRVVILAGRGGNGGGGMVAARRLAGWGAEVIVAALPPGDTETIADHQRRSTTRAGVEVRGADILTELPPPEVILDCVIGYSLRGAPRGDAAELITWANATSAPVLSLDVPSGLDADTAVAHEPSVQATATLTLALPKRGLRSPTAGDLFLADIGVPPRLYGEMGIEVRTPFASSDVVRLWS